MKLSKIILPVTLSLVVLTISNSPSYNQVQATDMECIEGCAAAQALGAKWCSLTWVNPAAYATCMLGVSAAFATCCYNCARSG
jgi:hypothetical protein